MAEWIEVTQKFDWRPPGPGRMRFMKTFEPGTHFMNDDQAAEAKRVGAGKPGVSPRKPEAKKVEPDAKKAEPVKAKDAD